MGVQSLALSSLSALLSSTPTFAVPPGSCQSLLQRPCPSTHPAPAFPPSPACKSPLCRELKDLQPLDALVGRGLGTSPARQECSEG